MRGRRYSQSMCGRISLAKPEEAIAAVAASWLGVEAPRPRFSVFPTQTSLVVVAGEGGRQARMARWGLVPSWARDPSIGAKMINARSETVTEKPAFRNLIGRRRCIVLTDGFFEWNDRRTHKVPFCIHAPGGAPLLMAGLWDTWRSPVAAEPLDSFAILTCEPRPDLAWLHDRMPVILPQPAALRWLDTAGVSKEDALALAQPYAGALEWHAVSKLVNSPRYDSAEVLRAVEADPQQPLF